MKIDCSYMELVDPNTLIPHPLNQNSHPEDQIKRLSEIISYQGQRSPVVVSTLSGHVVVGHGRLSAIKLLGWESIAVDYQDFSDEAQEYAHLTADNAIAEWSILDLSQTNKDFLEFGPDLKIDMLGLKNFTIEPFDELVVDSVEPEKPKGFVIEVKFPNEMEMMDIHDDLNSRGYMVTLK